MKRLFTLFAMSAMVLLQAMAVSVTDVCGKYQGDLNIGGDNFANKEVYLFAGTESNTVTFVLPDFTFSGTNLGNIVLTNIPMDNAGNLTLEGATLYIGALKERATIDIIPSITDGATTYQSQLTSASASVLLQITVGSLTEPLIVFFMGSRQTGNYDITNGGFDGSWTNNEINGWHSFASATGNFANMVSGNTGQFVQKDGHTGKGACITSNMIVGVKANGTMTNGQMNAGSMTATDATGNYAFSDPSNSGYNTPFVGNPDSISFWVKYVPADRNPDNSVNEARMHTALTTNARYQDPESDSYANARIAEAISNYKATSSLGWQKITVPFVYNGSSSKDNVAYILLTFTTCSTAGGGSTYSTGGLFSKKYYYDSCYIDDVALIYDTRLAALDFNGKGLSLTGNSTVDEPYSDEDYTLIATPKGVSAQSFIGYDAANNRALVYVMGHNYPANNSSYRLYQIQMAEPIPTGLENTQETMTTTRKFMQNGQIYIFHNNHIYDVLGNMIK